jgi:hypothetical protein
MKFRVFRWTGIALLSLVLSGVLYVFGMEGYQYLTQSEPKARWRAQAKFESLCKEFELSPQSFHGPERPNPAVDKQLGVYSYAWTRFPGEEIDVSITYLPFDVVYSASAKLIEENWRVHGGGNIQRCRPGA